MLLCKSVRKFFGAAARGETRRSARCSSPAPYAVTPGRKWTDDDDHDDDDDEHDDDDDDGDVVF